VRNRYRILATVGLLFASSPVWADGSIVSGCSTFSTVNAFKRCFVSLQKGQDYDFHIVPGDDASRLDFFDPVSHDLITQRSASTGDYDQEFRAAYTGKYRIEIRSGNGAPGSQAAAQVFQDCKRDGRTLCHIAKGQTVQGSVSGTGDVDAYRAYLRAGNTYTFSYGQGSAVLNCGNQATTSTSGQLIAHPNVTGLCVFMMAAQPGTYTLSLS
jgi:hypothetical protein